MHILKNFFCIVSLLLSLNGYAFDASSKEEALEIQEEVDELSCDYYSFPASDLELGRSLNTPVTPSSKVKKNHHHFDHSISFTSYNSFLSHKNFFKYTSTSNKKYLQHIYPAFNFW